MSTVPVREDRIHDDPPSRPDEGAARGRSRRALLLVAVLVPSLLLAAFVVWEVRTSRVQAWLLSEIGEEVTYRSGAGPSPAIRFPDPGPYEVRLGYTRLPEVVARLEERGFVVDSQAVVSDRFAELVDAGLFPIWHEKGRAGLEVLGRHDRPLHRSLYPERAYPTFESIPDLVVRTLLFIENKELLDGEQPFRNPAVEWDRLALATLNLALQRVGVGGSSFGGSTLATQMEKFRHSPGGLTTSPLEKLRQMASASVRAYLDGPRTADTRRRIVLDYVNAVPLAAVPGYGEVIGLGDGLEAWYGLDFDETNRRLRQARLTFEGPGLEPADPALGTGSWLGIAPPVSPAVQREAEAYRATLSLVLAHRRPSWYLGRAEGREALSRLTDAYLGLLEGQGVIPAGLADAARGVRPDLRPNTPPPADVAWAERKAANAARAQLLALVGAPDLYSLDRWDLTARTSVDGQVQGDVTDRLRALRTREAAAEAGLAASNLLARGDPAHVIYSFVLYERTPRGNAVRVQTDNFDGPFDLNQAARLELGSTAKLRTLVTYLEVVEALYRQYAGRPAEELRTELEGGPTDPITEWALGFLVARPDASLREALDAAMERRYSGSPGERFFTGGGTHVFRNFDATYDGSRLTVRESFRHSVNLAFIRIMRDVVRYHMRRVPGASVRILDDPADPVRREYLRRFADREGREFIRRFYQEHSGTRPDSTFVDMVGGRRLTPLRLGWAFRAVAPEAGVDSFAAVLRQHSPDTRLTDRAVDDLYRRTDPSGLSLQDLGYLAGVHPLELWVVARLREEPDVSLASLQDEGDDVRQEVYRWLFDPRRRAAQDRRIRTMLEVEAFLEIQRSWRRLGYPFENIVPSYGTSIGSSGDRPAALAELVGILLNDGVRMPTVRLQELRFGEGTPYETVLRRAPVAGERVLSSEVASVAVEAMRDVVAAGTARYIRDAFRGPDGTPVTVGGKTGTGNNQYKVFGSGGRLLETRQVNRTATFVFTLDDRFFGVLVAYVPGPQAASYAFTSALPVRILGLLAPHLAPLLSEDPLTAD